MSKIAKHIDELLALNDYEFIQCAYISILNREPDSEGASYYMNRLESGFSKTRILCQIYSSKENANTKAQSLDISREVYIYTQSEKPLIGWFIKIFRPNIESDNQIERRLRSIEIKINSLTKNILNTLNNIANAEMVNNLIPDDVVLEPPSLSELRQMSPRAKVIYFQLKKQRKILKG